MASYTFPTWKGNKAQKRPLTQASSSDTFSCGEREENLIRSHFWIHLLVFVSLLTEIFCTWPILLKYNRIIVLKQMFAAWVDTSTKTKNMTVTTNLWAKVLYSLATEDACFRMSITLGVVLIRSQVFYVSVPEGSRNGFGMRPYLLVQEKFV